MTCKIILCVNTAWNIANFRTGLIRAFLSKGYEVLAVAPSDEHVHRITTLGARFIPMEMDNKGTNPFRDFGLFLRFCRLFFREKPCIFLGYTIKPNIYGGLAAAFCGIPAINNVAGLGTVFIRETWLTWFVSILYRLSFKKAKKVFFQNNDDLLLFLQRGLVPQAVTDRLPGSGVNTEFFKPVFTHEDSAQSSSCSSYTSARCGKNIPFRFLLVARLLWDKGVGEFVEAAKNIRALMGNVEFQLLGFLDVANRTAVHRNTLDLWIESGIIQYLGEAVDVRPAIAQADCIVLPSYREGIPHTLLEASSMAKPIITTDTVGCRDVVIHGVTGFLCKLRDSEDLADKMMMMLNLAPEERMNMGLKGRAFMLQEFDEQIVIKRYLKAIKDIIEADSLISTKVRHH